MQHVYLQLLLYEMENNILLNIGRFDTPELIK